MEPANGFEYRVSRRWWQWRWRLMCEFRNDACADEFLDWAGENFSKTAKSETYDLFIDSRRLGSWQEINVQISQTELVAFRMRWT